MNVDDKRKKISDFLAARHFMNIANIDESGKPHVSLVAYKLDGDLNVLFLTHADSAKAKGLAKNNSVAFVVSDLSNPMTLQVTGKAEIIDSVEQKIGLVKGLSEEIYLENSYLAPLLKMPKGQINAYRVIAESCKLSDFRSVGEPVYYELDSTDLISSAPAKTV